MNKDEYQCSRCKGVFKYGWSEEEAIAEKESHFPEFSMSDCVVVCDDCYKVFVQ